MNRNVLGIVNKLTGVKSKKTDFKIGKKRNIINGSAVSTVLVDDNKVTVTKNHKPSIHALHAKSNLYRSVRAVWDLVEGMDIILMHDDVKAHIDKYVASVRDEANVKGFNERLHISDPSTHHKGLKTRAILDYVLIGANIIGETVIPYVEYEYSVELEVHDNEN